MRPGFPPLSNPSATRGGVLTLANVINDQIRNVTQARNLCANGGLEVDATGWVAGASNAHVRSSTVAKFGSWSDKGTWATGGAKIINAFSITLPAAIVYTASAYIWIPADWDGGPLRLGQTGFTSVSIASQPDANMALVDQWQRITMTFTPDAGDLAGYIGSEINGADPSNGKFIYLDGLQIEVGSVAHDYIDTSTVAVTYPVSQDGLSNDGSTGIWPAATNLVTNGGFETNFIGWSKIAALEIGQRIITDAKFGSACAQLYESSPAGAGEYIQSGLITGLSAATAYTASAWVKAVSKSGANAGALSIWWYTSADAFISASVVTFTTGTFDWTRFINTATSPALTAKARVVFSTDGATAATAFDIHVDGIQFETGSIATPYIETDGATASRSAGRVQMPWDPGLFTAQNFAIAVRIRYGGALATGINNYFSWITDTPNRVLAFIASSSTLTLRRGGAEDLTATITTPATGAYTTLIFQGSPTLLGCAQDGAAFQTAANSQTPAISAANIDFGSQASQVAGRELASDFLWAIPFKRGNLSTADSARINSFGNNKPTKSGLSGMPWTGIWDGRTGTFQRRIGA